MAVLALKEHNGLPLAALESPIDAVRLGLHVREQVRITLDVRAAGRSDLHEREFSLIGRIFLQEPLNREEPLQNSLGVVDRKSTRLNSSHLVISYAVFC